MKALQEVKSDLRYVYYGREGEEKVNSKGETYTQWSHEGVISIGYKFDEQGQLIFGIAFCSPEDAFSKKKARTIITQRMAAGKQAIVPEEEGESLVDMRYEDLVALFEEQIDAVAAKVEQDFPDMPKDAEFPKIAGVRFPRWLMKFAFLY